jgi:predicted DsbA family dithiol-disulfide isomerase
MQVEIWSDVVCPWCYIGKRRFESALAQFEQRDQVDVTWRSFELDPTAPQHLPGSLTAMLAEKYGVGIEQAEGMNRQVTDLAAAEGLTYRLDIAQRGNSFDAHRLIHLAATHGLQDAAKERLLRAYFTEGQAIGLHDTLAALGADIGLPEAEVRAMLASDAFAADVRADQQRGSAFGIRGVPFFVINEKYGISGAQSAETFLNALEQIRAEME